MFKRKQTADVHLIGVHKLTPTDMVKLGRFDAKRDYVDFMTMHSHEQRKAYRQKLLLRKNKPIEFTEENLEVEPENDIDLDNENISMNQDFNIQNSPKNIESSEIKEEREDINIKEEIIETNLQQYHTFTEDKNKRVCQYEHNKFSKNIEANPEEIIPKSQEVPKVLSNEAKKKIAKAAFEKAKEILKAKKAERRMKENNQICN